MKSRHIFLKGLLCILLPVLGNIQAWGGNTYYGRGTATVSSASPTGSGTVYVSTTNSGSGTYANTSSATGKENGQNNATVTVYAFAKANENYEFVGWNTSNGTTTTTSTNNPQTISGSANSTNENSPTNIGTLYAIFAAKPVFYFSATAVATPAGGGTASVSPATTNVRGEHWNSTSATTTATFTATPNSDYGFIGWSKTANGTIVSTANPYNPTLTSTSTDSGSPTNTTLYARFQPFATSITVSPASIVVYVNITSDPITHTVSPTGAYDEHTTYESANTSIATVDANGRVTGVSTGTTTITVRSLKGDNSTVAASTNVSVTVKNKVATPAINFEQSNDGIKANITCSSPESKIFYTINGGTPTASSTEYSTPISVVEGDVIRAIAIKDPADENWDDSDVATATCSLCTTDAPVITFEGNSSTGKATVTITAKTGETIYYTYGNSVPADPTTSSYDGTGTTTATINDVPSGSTVKAIAKSSSCQASVVVSKEITFSYADGGTVLLDDREDHTWTYYAGVDASVDGGNYNTNYASKLYSPNPRNVKITYKGNGGAVAWNAPQTEFVYYKTLEQINGKYSYTLIPNPFSKRPTEGNGNDRWRGFSTWKVVSVDGGTITSTNGNTTYAVNSTIPAETEICFNPTSTYTTNCLSMEVVLEAVWVQAYVATSVTTTGLNGTSYETNFVVLTNGTTNDINSFGRTATISALYPNGTTDGTNAPTANWTPTTGISGTFSCSNDTKVEYIRMSGSGTITANNKYLILGRGIIGGGTNGLCSGTVQGMTNTASNAQLNFHIRVESGIYNYLTFTNGYGSSYGTNPGGRNNNVVQFSSNNNFIRGTLGCDYDRATSNNTLLKVQQEMFYGYYSTFSNAGNTSRETFNVVAKSGDFCSSKNNDIADAEESFYASLGGQQTNVGRRVLTIEGGQFLSIAGGIDENNSATTESFFLRMKGGTLRGALYGSGAFAASSGIRRFVITGGTIKGWVAAGCNGTDPNQSGGTLPSDTYVYVGGNSHVGNNTDITINTSSDGNVFGAGSGNAAQATTGQVNNSNVVIADECYIKNNVYGGGNYGYSNATATVYVTGGEVAGSVFGGSNQKQGVTVNLNMTGGQVDKGVYGGSNVTGTISNNVTMNINGGQVGIDDENRANIHGGGYGQNTAVSGNVTVTLGECNSQSGVTVYGDVYGGSALGSVNTNANNLTKVTLNAGTIYGALYGGALGDKSSLGTGHSNVAAPVNGKVEVVVTGGSVITTTSDPNGEAGTGSVFGGNNVNGSPQSTIKVDIYRTNSAPAEDQYALHAVYGGGNQSAYNGTPEVTIHGGSTNSIEYVYGGGNAADVVGTNIKIYGGNKIGNVFGGGNGFSKTDNHTNANQAHYNPGANVTTSGTQVYIYGGTIDNVYGGSNQYGTITGDLKVEVESKAETGTGPCDIELANRPIHVGALYGGGNQASSAIGKITVKCMDEGAIIDNLFCGANQAEVTGNVNFTMTGGRIGNLFGGNNNSGNVSGSITVTVNWDGNCQNSYLGNVFGGGNLAPYTGSPEVNVKNGDVSGNVYGGGKGSTAVVTGSPVVLVGDLTAGNESYVATVGGDVYGGGDAAGVTGNPTVTIQKSNTVVGDGYGGGNAAAVTGTTSLTMTNGSAGNLYGGGRAAGVSSTATVNVSGGTVSTGIYGGCNTEGTVTGDITVNVTGGTVGADYSTDATKKANVHGGGYGNQTATSGNIDVNIGASGSPNTGTAVIYGDVYGGSALGNVNSDTNDYTHVNLYAGTIHGDAYGGGLGDATHAALVNGNVKVTQDGVAFVKATTTDDASNTVVTAGRIFGCNNLNGSPQGSVLVLVNKTVRSDGDPRAFSIYDTDGNITTNNYEMNAVYGGGNLAAYNPTNLPAAGQFDSYKNKSGTDVTHSATGKPIQVVINGCTTASIEYVYGGGNAAPTPCTDVLILGSYEIGYVFGGGNGKDKYTLDGGTTWNTNPGADVGLFNGSTYGSGDANTSLYGGKIHEAYGASNQKGTIKGSINLDVKEGEVDCVLEVGKIVGAGKNADVEGDIALIMGCMPADKKTNLVFGGADNANVNGNVELTITSGTFGQVFGGNNLGGVIKGHIKVNIEETGCNPIKIDELYLGGNQAAYSRFGYYADTNDNGKLKPRESEDDSHAADDNPSNNDNKHPFPYAEPELNVISCTYIGKVFGGGLGTGAAMYADPTVNLNMIQGAFAEDNDKGVPAKMTELRLNSADNPNKLGVLVDVYGGGNEAAVNGNTKVNIATEIGNNIVLNSPEGETVANRTKEVVGAFVSGTVYGAGRGNATEPSYAIVTGNTQVNMKGGHVSRSIYGGGELSSVGTFTETYTTEVKHPYHAAGEPKTCKAGTGVTEVKISGGQVGLVNQLMPDPSRPTSDDDYGYIFCAGKGVADSLTYNKAHLLAVSGSSHLEISGGLVAASVYGGSENGQVLGDTYVEIKGGQIGSGYNKANGTWDAPYTEGQWTAAINAINSGVVADINTAVAPFHECDAWSFGAEGSRHVYDYFHGTAGYDSKGGTNDPTTDGGDGHSYYGHVFGGGSGYYPFAAGKWRRTAGRVNGNTVVEISGGHVLTNVYGGNEITDVLGSSKVEMWGGTVGVPRTIAGIQARPVNSYIFGAGMGDPRTLFNGWSNVGSAEVIVRGDAVVFGSVFGGGEDGHVLGDVSTTIKGDALIGTFGSSGVDGNIFGSGRGFSALTLTAGAVCGNVTVNIAERAKILGSIFGGGRMAAVGTYLALETDANYGKLIAEGQDPYGTGSTKHGNVTINITGGTIGNLSQMDSPNSIGDVFGGSKGVLMSEWAKSQKLGLVKNTTVKISQAAGYTTTIYGNVYGGGELASVGSYEYATTADNTLTEPIAVGDVNGVLEANTGKATILITGGTIGQNSLADKKGSVFGGCLGKAGAGYSGYSFVNNSDVTLNGGTVYGCIFGGGENGHVFSDTDVKIKKGTVGIRLDNVDLSSTSTITDAEKDNMIYRGNVYGGGRGVDKTTGNEYSITAGKVGGNTNVTIEGDPETTIIYRNVYGGGSLASVGNRDEVAVQSLVTPTHPFPYNTGLAKVTIKGGTIGTDGGAAANNYNTNIPDREYRKENGFVYGSGRGMAAGATDSEILVQLAYTKNTLVSIEGTGDVTGSVFGGGENGHVQNDTKVFVKGGSVGTELNEAEHKIFLDDPVTNAVDAIDDNGRGRLIYRGNVYGGGRGVDKASDGNYSLTAGRVHGNTFVEVSGGNIYHDVFGGGSLASVGNETIKNGEVTYGDDSGQTEVHINGGIIGFSETYPELMGFNCGFVYGGCRGLSAAPGTDIVKMAYVHNTKVYIEEGAKVKGSVFGGGANGHVKNDTEVIISGGEVGTALKNDELGLDDHGVASKSVYRGNVYAGGRGVDMYQQNGSDVYSMSAGAVYGNAKLTMTGGHVWHNIYGSGAMASVGTVEAITDLTTKHVHDQIVDTNGDPVNDFALNPDESKINYLTGVFKANTGKVTMLITGGIVGDTESGHEGINNGNVFGAGRGVSANRSDLVASMEFVNETEVTIGSSDPSVTTSPYIYGNVYGGGENGHVKTNTKVYIKKGIIGWPLVPGTGDIYSEGDDGSAKNPYRGHVFGGGCGVDPLYHGSSEVRSSTAGRVYGHTNVEMTGGVVRRAIYGGGMLASVGVYKLLNTDMHIIDMIEDEVDAGDATVTISGGYIGNVDTDGSALGSGYLAPGDNNGFVYGSSCGMVADIYEENDQQNTDDVQYRQMGYTHSTHVSISGDNTRVFGCVFGSGENGHVWEDTQINISGGQVGSEGNTSIYVGNVYGSGRGVDHPHAHISETAGKVRGNTEVNVTGGIVWRDVYGGGSLASVGEANEAANSNLDANVYPFPYKTGLTRVTIDGTSAVHGSVYGSGRGVASTNPEYRQAAYVKNTLVTVKGTSHVFQNVFGGGNAGHVRKNTNVTIDGSATVDGNVYGGGAGDISSPTAGLVNHDVVVNIKNGLVKKDVYGGGAIANSNVHDGRNKDADDDCAEGTNRGNAKTEVNLLGGIILGDAYGGGQGVIPASTATEAEIANAAALVQGDVTVTLNGTAFYPTTINDNSTPAKAVPASGRVFGCNNLNGTPQGTVLVHVLQTKGVTKSGDTYTVKDTHTKSVYDASGTLTTNNYEVGAVYGGGNLAAYEPWNAGATGQYTTDVVAANNPLQVVIDGCDNTSIDYVYGGGNAASVPSAQVTVLGTYEIGTVFGGGNGKDKYTLDGGTTWNNNLGAHVGYKAANFTPDPNKTAEENEEALNDAFEAQKSSLVYGTGNANVYLFGGTIHNAFGASNTLGNIAGKAEVHVDEKKNGTTPICPLVLDELYGGGNEAYMEGGTNIDLGCVTYLKTIYGGAKNANVNGDINLTITSGHFDRVFGGNNVGGVISGSITVNIEETGCNPITIGELYGCGNQARYTTPGSKHPTINVKSFTSIGRIFGGGLGASAVVTGNPTVNINLVVGENAAVASTYPGTTITYSDGSSVTLPAHDSGKIGSIGTVFGGGNAAKVVGNTYVNIGTEATIKYTSDAVDATGRTVLGADIRGNVFGGGNAAEVTGHTNVEIGQKKTTP